MTRRLPGSPVNGDPGGHDELVPREDQWLISVDDHVIEPCNLWQDRLPFRYRESGPCARWVDRGEAWFFENQRISPSGLAAAAAWRPETLGLSSPTLSDLRPGCSDSTARVSDLDRSGVIASVCFPWLPGPSGQLFTRARDRRLGELCVRAYNDFIIEEWCGRAPGRFVPLMILPLWDRRRAVAEIHRTATLGAKAISFTDNPSTDGLPALHHDGGRYWDPVFAAAAECGMPLCIHAAGTGSVATMLPSASWLASMTTQPMSLISAAADWLFSGILARLSGLELLLCGGGLGWLPWILQRADATWARQRSAGDSSIPPSQLFRDHMYVSFSDEPEAALLVDQIGADNVMVASDYPHSESSWPCSSQLLDDQLADLFRSDRLRVLRGNAERVFEFTPAATPAPW